MNNYSNNSIKNLDQLRLFHNDNDLIEQILKKSVDIGANDASVTISRDLGLSVSIRHGELETIEQSNKRSIEVIVYAGQCYGSASTSDFSKSAIDETIKAAWDLANKTAKDYASGLPDTEDLATNFPDLNLYHPWVIDVEKAKNIAILTEKNALSMNSKIETDGAQVSMNEGHFLLGNTLGFRGEIFHSNHDISFVAIANDGSEMQRDYWYTSNRNPLFLSSPENVGLVAAQRALSRLGARKIKTGKFPVIFEAPIAMSLLGNFTQATSGGSLYRKSSFLLNCLGKEIFPKHIEIFENPHILGGMGSRAFDDEGVRTSLRKIVDNGILQGYFLSTYTARKLGMKTTGNCGGSHNLVLRSDQTNASDNIEYLLKKMGTGLLVTELIGQGVNYVTGDYSRGVFGYWVQNGELQHAVQEVTIAGNLSDMFRNIVAIGSDSICRGTKTSGSILIENMTIAGS